MNKLLFALLLLLTTSCTEDGWDPSGFLFGSGEEEPSEEEFLPPPPILSDSNANKNQPGDTSNKNVTTDTPTTDFNQFQDGDQVYKEKDTSPIEVGDVVDYDKLIAEEENKKLKEELRRELEAKHAEEMRHKQAELDLLKKASTPIKLQKSTYKPKYPKAVKRILYELSMKYVKKMKKDGNGTSISPAVLKLHTIEYCDDRILQYFDETVEKNILYITNKVRWNKDKTIQNKASEVDELIRLSKS